MLRYSIEFENKKKQAELEFESCKDKNLLKEKVISLRKELDDSSSDIPKYDAERYSNDIDKLLKKINCALRLESNGARKIDFRNKLSLSKMKNERKIVKPTLSPQEEPVKNEDFSVGQDILLNGSSNFVNNLLNCAAFIEDNSDVIEYGALSFQNIKNSIINLNPISFMNGSVIFKNCNDSVIIIKLPSANSIQVRLHSLNSCRLYFNLPENNSQAPQNVVIENCDDCIIHTDSKDLINVQNFSNLGFHTEKDSSYTFGDFDLRDLDTLKLKQKYIKV
ncbi:hypothetical protein Kpol_1060p31 [Vanderwaltozyma polyspora DSM 70294]|uniref:C-CAP/cofactor C-like domain-containing protein n=1 Tax=Vanderwaltozyma polyspora (strain ATCC 22028 / DSM 70294 / BCRC 21397 / CBS 2163 / NBRC 10782 / NRRL Y-8283 / UCD 57-17) TaxID=436907 RepID=A7TK29_VANPO|nr:uncharacterized protein Kpol_1060p31 [Vanderwaltozyma polyspora DSM 70294]EDO17375.1 hypothetical protein Kpol_1060p31 [Vanderwaltozyma polyspora DSM 70294]